MKIIYERPQIEVVEIEIEEAILTASAEGDGSGDGFTVTNESVTGGTSF